MNDLGKLTIRLCKAARFQTGARAVVLMVFPAHEREHVAIQCEHEIAADLPRLLREWADSFEATQGRIPRPDGQSLGKVLRPKRKTRMNKGED